MGILACRYFYSMLDYHKLADEKHGFLTKPLRLSWGRLGLSWGRLGAVLGCLGHFGAVLAPSWSHFGLFWAVLGHLGAVFKPSAAYQRHAERRRSCGGAVE